MIDKDGLFDITNKKVELIKTPLQIIVDEQVYDLERDEFKHDIDLSLYDVLIKLKDSGNSLKMRLTDDMKKDEWEMLCEFYCGKKIRFKELKCCLESFKSISYNPVNNNKFIAAIDVDKSFIHVYEFESDNNTYVSKYIHCEYSKENNLITHMDYSLNTYTLEQYSTIINNPNRILKANEHKKIWRVDGNVNIKMFYKIIFSLYSKNKKYIKELFKYDEDNT